MNDESVTEVGREVTTEYRLAGFEPFPYGRHESVRPHRAILVTMDLADGRSSARLTIYGEVLTKWGTVNRNLADVPIWQPTEDLRNRVADLVKEAQSS